MTDITPIIAAQRAHERSERRLRSILDSTADALVTVTTEGLLTSFNAAAVRLFGYSPQEVVGRPARLLLADPDEGGDGAWTADPNHAFTTVDGGRVRRIAGRHEDGSALAISLRVARLQGPTDEGFVGSLKDDSVGRHGPSELDQQRERLETLGALAGGIAHDFNNILSPILGSAALLTDRNLDARTRSDLLREIEAAATRGAGLTRQILRFGRPDPEERRSVDVAAVVNEAAGLLRASLPATIELRLRVARDLPRIRGDATQVHQAIVNLGINAGHAVGERPGVITISAHQAEVPEDAEGPEAKLTPGPYIAIEVHDTGDGVPAELVDRIFEPFFTTKPSGKGHGLGLPSVRRIARTHDGWAWARPATAGGGGGAMLLYLSVEPPAAAESEAPGQAPEQRPAGRCRVLLVDDEPAVLKALAMALESQGMQVSGFTVPADALQTFAEAPADFDVAVVDQAMPNMTGVELADRLRERDPALPVVLCTGRAHQRLRSLAASAGIGTVLQKPLMPGALATEVARAARRPANRPPATADEVAGQ